MRKYEQLARHLLWLMRNDMFNEKEKLREFIMIKEQSDDENWNRQEFLDEYVKVKEEMKNEHNGV